MARRIPTFIEYKAAMSKQLGKDLSILSDETVWESYIRVYPEAVGGTIIEEPIQQNLPRETIADAPRQSETKKKKGIGCGGVLLCGFIFVIIMSMLSSPSNSSSSGSSAPAETIDTTAQRQEAEAKAKEKAEAKRQSEEAEKAAQEKFKKWALEHTAVTDIEINGKTSMFVTLSPEKYTNRDNVRLIAEQLARSYANQVGSNYTVCRIYLGNEVYAEGEYSN